MDDMVIKEPAMEAVVKRLQITVGCLDRPTAHVLCRDEDAVILELFCQAVDRLGIHILIVVDACNERWRGNTVPEFEPKVVKKNQTDISDIEDQVLSMYAKGMTTRDISAHLRDVYGVDASAEMISHMTDRILPLAREWQNRPWERKYAIVFMDAVHFHVREDNRTVKKAVYVAIGTKLNGSREVLGMWIGGN